MKINYLIYLSARSRLPHFNVVVMDWCSLFRKNDLLCLPCQFPHWKTPLLFTFPLPTSQNTNAQIKNSLSIVDSSGYNVHLVSLKGFQFGRIFKSQCLDFGDKQIYHHIPNLSPLFVSIIFIPKLKKLASNECFPNFT